MRTCVFSGTFDPFTLGHLDVLKRAAATFDHVVVGIFINLNKVNVFTEGERKALIEQAAVEAGVKNVTVTVFHGMQVELCRAYGARVIVRGLRSTADLLYEQQMAVVNRMLDPEIDTVFFVSDPVYGHLSSSIVREAAAFGGDISQMMPKGQAKFISERLLKK